MKKIYKKNILINKPVDFLICGTQKGGTTALDNYLRSHPEICMASKKEVHFFDTETNFTHGRPDYYMYHSFFNPNESQKLLGEATPIYMYWHEAPKRIWKYNPDIKLIVLLRNPIERAFSHWNMEVNRNAEKLSFWEAIHDERERCREALPLQHIVYSYIDRGFYLEQLRRLWMYFPKKQVLVLKSEYLKNQPDKALNEICRFLKINEFKFFEEQIVFSTPYTSKITDKEREFLRIVFRYEIKGIEQVLKWDCSDWLSS